MFEISFFIATKYRQFAFSSAVEVCLLALLKYDVAQVCPVEGRWMIKIYQEVLCVNFPGLFVG